MVIIYQRVLPHYRVPFFEALHKELLLSDIKLVVVAGNEKKGQVPKTVKLERPWVVYRENIYISLLGKEIVLQRMNFGDFKANAVIVEQSNRLFLNYILCFFRLLGCFKVGLWGHGKNFQSSRPRGLRERFKQKISKTYDWWFCYTELGKKILSSAGCDQSKITVVRNSIELTDFEDLNSRESLGSLHFNKFEVFPDDNLGIYCGGAYHEKRIDFLLESLTLIRERVKNFKFIFIGDGPEINKVEKFHESNHDWFYWAGAKSGKDRAEYFRYAKVFLMPGLVGLAVLDSFASAVPMITTNIDYHSPEIDYLENGINGLIINNSLADYVSAVEGVLNNDKELQKLREGCVESAKIYSIGSMSKNYAQGVVGLLGGYNE